MDQESVRKIVLEALQTEIKGFKEEIKQDVNQDVRTLQQAVKLLQEKSDIGNNMGIVIKNSIHDNEATNGERNNEKPGIVKASETFTNESAESTKDYVNFDLEPSLHSYTVFTLMSKQRFRAAWYIFLSAALVTTQLLILQTIVVESQFAPCSVHSDCSLGEYCGNNVTWTLTFNVPRCTDCMEIYEYWYDKRNFTSQQIDEYCANFTKVVAPWDHGNVDHKYFVYNSNVTIENQESSCLSYLHCNNTDRYDGKCDHSELNVNKITPHFKLSTVFLGMLGIAPQITSEMEESMKDEYLLHSVGVPTASKVWFRILFSVARQIVYVILRLRRYGIPFLAITATAGIMLNDNYQVQNIVLNILSVTFITDIDNMALNFFVPPFQLIELENFVEEVKERKVFYLLSFFSWYWTRIVSLFMTSVMIVAVLKPHWLNPGLGCNHRPLFVYLLTGLGAILLSQSFFLGVLSYFKRKKILWSLNYFLMDLMRNAVAYTYMVTLFYNFGVYGFTYLDPLKILAVIVGCLGVLSYTFSYLKNKHGDAVEKFMSRSSFL